jgi:hypothetical protein
MDSVVVLAVIAGPIVLVFAFGKTPLWWLAGCSVGALATYLLTTLAPVHDHGNHDGGMGAWDGIGNVIQTAAGVVLMLYAIALLLGGRSRYTRARQLRRHPPIPPATVV